ncbi:MAG: hypothetical protein Tsb0015_11470 [Simkaniaceae bacterium]
MKKRVSALILIVFLFSTFLVYFKFVRRTKGFSLNKIVSSYPPNAIWQTKPPDNLEEIFSGPFYYLGSGKECYAFVSENNQYVIKFFKQKHMRIKHPLNVFSFIPSIQQYVAEKQKKHASLRNKMFQSYWIAFHELPEETGVIFLHLSKTHNLKRKGLFYDQNKHPFVLDLDQMEFLIQRKAEPVFTAIADFYQRGEEIKTKQVLQNILALIIERCKKGIGDEDMNCERNLGVVGTKAMEIDVGEFYQGFPITEPSLLKKELEKATIDLCSYLNQLHPKWSEFLQSEIKRITEDGSL